MLILSGSLFLYLFVSVTTPVESHLMIFDEDGRDFTNKSYYYNTLDSMLQFTCNSSLGDNVGWYLNDLEGEMEVPSEINQTVFQMSTPVGQVLYMNVENSGPEIRFTCRSGNMSLSASLTVKEGIVESVRALNSTSVTITWKAASQKLPITYCLAGNSASCQAAPTANSPDRQYHINGLMPFTSYEVHISDYIQIVQTLQASPAIPPRNVTYTIEDPDSVVVSWLIPESEGRNGIITHYLIRWSDGLAEQSKNYSLFSSNFSYPEVVSVSIAVQENSVFSCQVAAGTTAGLGPFSPQQEITIRFLQLSSGPVDNDKVLIRWKVPELLYGDNEPEQITVQHRLYQGQGRFINVSTVDPTLTSVVLGNLAPGKPYEVFIAIRICFVTSIKSIIVFSKETSPMYTVKNLTATPLSMNSVMLHWTPLTLGEAGGFPVYRIILVSESGSQLEYETNDSRAVVTDLEPSSNYVAYVEVFTKGGKSVRSEASFAIPFENPPDKHDRTPSIIGICIGVIVPLILLAIVTAVVILCIVRRRCQADYGKVGTKSGKILYGKMESGVVFMVDGEPEVSPFDQPAAPLAISHSDSVDSLYVNDTLAIMLESKSSHDVSYMNVKPCIPVAEFANFVAKMKGGTGFRTEYESLPLIDDFASTSAAKLNARKNRYDRILPYDHSRVIICGDSSDYINASFINDYKGQKGYIAAQGPMAGTIGDFWKMVWEQKSSVIVMLTKLEEGGKLKCDKYWNDEMNQRIQLNSGVTLALEERKVFSEYVLRTFSIQNAAEDNSDIRVVYHFHYTAWPDHGIPRYPGSLLRFIQSVNHCRGLCSGRNHPLIVHCSAGVGRTGTFIAIDAMVQRLKEKNDLNIYEFLHNMRCHRPYMILNQDQYVFVHEALCDYTISGDTSIDTNSFIETVHKLKNPTNAGVTGFDVQFECLAKLSRKPTKEDEVLAERNMDFIRFDTHYPYASNYILVGDGEKRDYFNASSINTYSQQHAFIATQYPLPNTVTHLLDVIYQRKCKTCVVLCHDAELGSSSVSFPLFWPTSLNDPLKFGCYEIYLDESIHKEGYSIFRITINSSLKSFNSSHEFTVLHIKEWLEAGDASPSTVLSLVREYEKAQKGVKAPAIVMCSDGMGRTGTFISIVSEIERIKMEARSDVFQSVKAARNQRPYMVSTVDQYILLHEALIYFMKSFQTYNNFK